MSKRITAIISALYPTGAVARHAFEDPEAITVTVPEMPWLSEVVITALAGGGGYVSMTVRTMNADGQEFDLKRFTVHADGTVSALT